MRPQHRDDPAAGTLRQFSLAACRRLVIKIGSALLTNEEGTVGRAWLAGVAADVAAARKNGQQVIVVSSGAISIGSRLLAIDRRRSRLEALQAAAAAGQVHLVRAWQEAFDAYGIAVAQILLALGDTENRRRFLNARGTLEKLLEHGVLPVVNENDTVATEEIRYGDNDRLAARVAQLVMADGLLLLSDVDGLYTADPGRDPGATHVREVTAITPEIEAMAAGARSPFGSGGMATKVQAARIAIHAGCTTVIASGRPERPISALLAGGRCTVFRASATPAAVRKQWLAGALAIGGSLTLDAGAVAALRGGASLLPVGVTAVSGAFSRGDPVLLLGAQGEEVGRGLAAYSAEEAGRILRCRSGEIAARLGYQGRAVMVHRDDLVMFGKEE